MSVLNELASALGRRDEVPNHELARKIVATQNKAAVKELIDNLENKSKDIRHDCIKTLYEAGHMEPELIGEYADVFGRHLDSKLPRMVWGAMSALSAAAKANPEAVFEILPKIMEKADNSGSVIARDHAIYILATVGKLKKHYEDCVLLIKEELMKAPVNQFAMYCEITAPIIQAKDKDEYRQILEMRLEGIDQEPKRKRVLKVLKKLGA